MTPEIPDQPLNLISTRWSLVHRAHCGPVEGASAARQQLLQRYGGAVYRYLHKVTHDPDAVDEVFQEFALRLMHGDFGGANPDRGRFRDFVKGVLFHLIADLRKRNHRWSRQLPNDGSNLPAKPEDAEFDHQFVESWCDELLAGAWAALADFETLTGRPYYGVLRFRAEHPELRSPELAARLSVQFEKPFTAAGVRQFLHRAREKFADLLLEKVVQSLEDPSAENLERELIDLGLFEHCHLAIERQSLIA